ncbi:hypothetical protein C8J56DRAFT_15829 [Mycena floridula]|nr:hypothetical protein C8J56DRAFT_15829 [Mycena floridula]
MSRQRPSTAQGTSSEFSRPTFKRASSDSNPSLHLSQSVKPTSTFISALEAPPSTLPTSEPPQRPVRNPARTAATSRVKPNGRPNTSNGTREEITPWELYDPPPESEKALSPSKGMLRASTRPAPTGDILVDLGLKRRKSTGSKLHRPKVSSGPPKSTSTLHPPTTERPPSKSAPAASLKPPETTQPSPAATPSSDSNNLKFSTVDRTILEELKRNIIARASQFVLKGGSANGSLKSAGWGAQGIGAAKKHHPYPKEEVPYPRNYERDVLDLDVWEGAFCQQICGSLTFHAFEKPPTRVLDLGCGTGTWLLNCARAWRGCHFVGLDIVPLHPDLQQVGSVDLASRITWVQANFLEGLPFPNEEFDYVHIKRISLGVPEDKWDALLEEITRVMKPGGAFEMIEEDLFFPGKSADDDDELETGHETESLSAEDFQKHRHRRSSLSSLDQNRRSWERTHHHVERDRDSDSFTGSGSGGSRRASTSIGGRPSDEQVWSPATSIASTASPTAAAHPPSSPVASVPSWNSEVIVEEQETEVIESSSANVTPTGTTASRSQPPPPPPLRLHATNPSHHHAPGFQSSTRPKSQGKFSGSADWLMASLAPHPESPRNSTFSPQSAVNKTAPFLLRSIPRPPSNPRDHSLLELIYNETCESRFINLSPLSLLTNLLGLHFQDVRSHPPLQLTFPPRPKPHVEPLGERPDESDPDDDARDAIIPNRSKRPSIDPATPRAADQSATSYFSSASASDPEGESRFLSIHGLVHGTSQYVTVDVSRISAFSPRKKMPKDHQPSVQELEQSKQRYMRQNRLPNATMNMDIRTLNLHLAVRTREILACAESMWEWILQHQKHVKAVQSARRARAGSVDAYNMSRDSSSESPSLKSTVDTLTREDFDALLSNFEMDMQDHMALGWALEDRFHWPIIPSSPTAERKLFNNDYSQWVQWDQNEKQRTRRPPSMDMRSPNESTHSIQRSSDLVSPSRGRPAARRDSTDRTSSQFSSTHELNMVLPNRKLSRIFKVFVGWKPMEVPEII